MQIPLIPPPASKLRLRRLGIYAYQEPVLHLHRDCPVCHSEGSEGQSRVELKLNGRTIVATAECGERRLPSIRRWLACPKRRGAC